LKTTTHSSKGTKSFIVDNDEIPIEAKIISPKDRTLQQQLEIFVLGTAKTPSIALPNADEVARPNQQHDRVRLGTIGSEETHVLCGLT
jgi:hypothetical protein